MELEGSLERATFNTWIRPTHGEYDPDAKELKLYTANHHAYFWITTRLMERIQDIVDNVAGTAVTITVTEHVPPVVEPAVAVPLIPAVPQPALIYPEPFPHERSNWTKTPNHFFDRVLTDPEVKSTTARIVAAVIYHTVGNVDRLGNGKEWWEGVNNNELGRAAGIKSRTSVKDGVLDALGRGWIKRRKSATLHEWDYAVRWVWD